MVKTRILIGGEPTFADGIWTFSVDPNDPNLGDNDDFTFIAEVDPGGEGDTEDTNDHRSYYRLSSGTRRILKMLTDCEDEFRCYWKWCRVQTPP